MRRYTQDGMRVPATGATRDYVLNLEPPDEFAGPKRTYKQRDCPMCGARLSTYNLAKSGLCWPCQKRADEPLPAAAWVEVFEHVAAALGALWDSEGTSHV